MHVLFLTDNFPPEANAPASRTHEHCRVWVEAGHQVTVVTCAPNFPKGEVFAGYRNAWRQEETIDGIRVIRVWSYITANEGFARRILDYLSFMATASIAGPSVPEVDIVVGTSPQFFTACAACFVGAVKRRPWVFELRDLWPESIRAVGAMRDSWLLRDTPDVRILLLGDGARKEALVARARELGVEGNVVFIDSVPKSEVVRYWSLLDVSIIHLRRTPLFETVIPSKLFECMGMGIPVLHGVAGESAGIVEREGAGWVFEPEDASALAALVRRVRADPEMLAACRERCLAAAGRYDRRALALAMLGELDRVAARR